METDISLLRVRMMDNKPKKRFDKLGYGALALYVSLMAVMALGVYGINITAGAMDQSRAERARAQLQSGRMVILTEDRTQCRSIRFDNETSELGRETLGDCDARLGGTLGMVRDGFTNR
jgi:hypothetical protein